MEALHRPRYRLFLIRLRRARIEAGMTQPQAAAVLKQPQQFVSKCELGERRVDAVELWDFARLYGKSLDFFFADLEQSKPAMRRPSTKRRSGR